MSSLYRPDLCFVARTFAHAEEALQTLAKALTDAGLVRPTFAPAVLAREATSPTGLPLFGRKAAVPHADPEHVITPAVALCTLAEPLAFGEMGNPGQRLDVEVIALLALPDHQSAQAELVRLVERFQDPAFLDLLCAAPDNEALYQLVSQ